MLKSGNSYLDDNYSRLQSNLSVRYLNYSNFQDALVRIGADLASKIVLVGGQALNLWADHFKTNETLDKYGPYSSKDIDFQGESNIVVDFARRLNGAAQIPDPSESTVNTGVVIYTDEGENFKIDFIKVPYGLKETEVLEMAIPFEFKNDKRLAEISLNVLHPIHCLVSRVSNCASLPGYKTEHALNQLKASVIIAKEFLADFLDKSPENQKKKIKIVKKLNEKIYKFCKFNIHAKEVKDSLGIDPFDAVFDGEEIGPIRQKYNKWRQELQIRSDNRKRLTNESKMRRIFRLRCETEMQFLNQEIEKCALDKNFKCNHPKKDSEVRCEFYLYQKTIFGEFTVRLHEF